MTEDQKKVAAEQCHCVPCDSCGGTGTVFYAVGGNFLGNHRGDDLDTMEPCEECHNGIVESCSRCDLLEEMDREQDEIERSGGPRE